MFIFYSNHTLFRGLLVHCTCNVHLRSRRGLRTPGHIKLINTKEPRHKVNKTYYIVISNYARIDIRV